MALIWCIQLRKLARGKQIGTWRQTNLGDRAGECTLKRSIQ